MSVYCASPKAIKAAALAYGPESNSYLLADALIAAHHEKLGVDRSVCLSDVLYFLRFVDWQEDTAADAVEAHFAALHWKEQQ